MKKKTTKSVTKPVKVKPVKELAKVKTVDKVKAETKADVEIKNVETTQPTKNDFGTNVVKVISVLGLIGSTFMMLVGLIFLFFRNTIIGQIPLGEIPAEFAHLIPVILTVMGIFMILFGAAWFIVSINLWQLKRWAWIVAIVFASIGAVSSLLNFPAGWFGFLLHGTVLYFLAFNPDVKKLFE